MKIVAGALYKAGFIENKEQMHKIEADYKKGWKVW